MSGPRKAVLALCSALGISFFSPALADGAPATARLPALAPSPAPLALTADLSAPLAFAGLTLQQAQQAAVPLSPEVLVARAQVDAASAALTRARASFGPSVIAGYTRNPQAGSSPQPASVEQKMFNVGLQTTLGNLAAYLPALSQADAAFRSARFAEQSAERSERIKVTNLYFAALNARATEQARGEALQLAHAQLQAAQKRFAAGDAPRIDVVRSEVTVARATADYETAKAADANAAEALALETGVPVDALQQTVAGTPPAVPPALLAPNVAVQIALTQRGDVQAARDDVRAAAAGLRSARVGLLPAVTVSAGYAHGIDTGQAVSGPMVNASFELPLNGAASSQISSARASVAEAQARLRGAERQVTLEVGSAVRNLNGAILATLASTRAQAMAREELTATEIGYRTGASSSLERAAANAAYADARLAALSAIYNEATARAILALEIGP